MLFRSHSVALYIGVKRTRFKRYRSLPAVIYYVACVGGEQIVVTAEARVCKHIVNVSCRAYDSPVAFYIFCVNFDVCVYALRGFGYAGNGLCAGFVRKEMQISRIVGFNRLRTA